ncbi:unnamed protein product [Ambrosiozyma monospora]|uniref:Unnamed protein product n=1 Tax=Ambrosiozyma monospora TaxID=43982 RepID=A0ACB5SYX2_AMBMO|nr:unnamed protein product [Ambrosiozyma monospora]
MKTSHILVILFHILTVYPVYAAETSNDDSHLSEVTTTSTSKSSSTSTSTSTSSTTSPTSTTSTTSTTSSASSSSSSASSSDYNATAAYKSFMSASKASAKSAFSVSTASVASAKSASTESVAREKSMSTESVASVKSASKASVKSVKSQSKESVKAQKTADKLATLSMTITDPSDYTPTFNPVPSFSPTVSKLRTHSSKLTNHVIDHSFATNDFSSKLSTASQSFISSSFSNLSAVETIPASSYIAEETAAINHFIGDESGSSSANVPTSSGFPNQNETSETESECETTSIIMTTSVQSHVISSGTLTITYSATTFAAKRDEFGSDYYNTDADYIYVDPEESLTDDSLETQSKLISYAATVVVTHVSTRYHTDELQTSGTRAVVHNARREVTQSKFTNLQTYVSDYSEYVPALTDVQGYASSALSVIKTGPRVGNDSAASSLSTFSLQPANTVESKGSGNVLCPFVGLGLLSWALLLLL